MDKTKNIKSGQRLIITIDPGSTGTGAAFWLKSEFCADKPAYPLCAYNYYPEADSVYNEWIERCQSTVDKLFLAVDQIGKRGESIDKAIMEYPEYFDMGKGLAAANSGSLVKLSFTVGAIYYGLQSRNILTELVKPSTWIGQLPKQQMIKRVRDRLPGIDIVKPKEHMWDAIGLGLYAQGHFQPQRRRYGVASG